MKKRSTLLLAGTLMAIATAATAANRAETFYISPVVGGYTFEGKQHLETAPVYGLKLGYNFTDRLGIEGAFDYAATEGTRVNKDVSFYKYGADLIYNFIPSNKLVPFLAVGYSGYNFNGSSDLVEKGTRPAFDYGAGLKYFLNDNFAIRGDVRHVIASLGSDSHDRNAQNIEYTLGAYIPFGGTQPVTKTVEPAPAPKPVVVAPAPAPAPAPPADSDRDGVIDANDKCPTTPLNVAVDADGCPIDTDGDGVADYLDKCPATPSGVKVDSNGCPLDSDKDGVLDYLDKCPDTPAGVKVTADGCPIPAPKAALAEKFCSKPAVVDVKFATNKTAIDNKYVGDLKTLGEFLKEFPEAKGEISGHTDNVGGKAFNQKLSEQRADAVKKYLVNTFGVDPSRITTKGYGFSKPVADNKTAAGKAKNRRIEALFTCE